MSAGGIVLIVLGAILLLIVCILLLRVRIRIRYNGELTMDLLVLFLRFRLFPKKRKKVRLSEYSGRRYRKKLEKDAQRAERKAKKKAEKKNAKQKKKAERKAAGSSSGPKSFSDIRELIGMVAELAGTVIRTFFGHLRIDVAKMHLTVASDDAAKTAILYGAAAEGVAAVLLLLDEVSHIRSGYKADISVEPDFLAAKGSADIDLTFSLRVIHALDVLVRGGFVYLRHKAEEDDTDETSSEPDVG